MQKIKRPSSISKIYHLKTSASGGVPTTNIIYHTLFYYMHSKIFKYLAAFLLSIWSIAAYANPPKDAPFIGSEATQPLAIAMFIVIFLLLAVIGVLTRVIFISSDIYRKKVADFTNNSKKIVPALAVLIGVATLLPNVAVAQEVADNTVAASELIGGLRASSFYFLFGFIILELVIVLALLRIFFQLMAKKKNTKAKEAAQKIHWIEKINAAPSAKGITDEEISMGHDFDGIEELDNPTPPWWRWGFVLSVVIGLVYIWYYEMNTTTPDQYEELAITTRDADEAVKEYLAKSANNVDENTVVFLENAADIAAGQAVFVQMCAACHGPEGGGNEVGPNLTDEYWLHGGSVSNIFKTIKYGVTEKGMKSWKDDFSPMQIAQLSSYIKSLKGSSPANAKAPQGELYVAEAAAETSETAPEATAITDEANTAE